MTQPDRQNYSTVARDNWHCRCEVSGGTMLRPGRWAFCPYCGINAPDVQARTGIYTRSELYPEVAPDRP